jgi:hypothetical protein
MALAASGCASLPDYSPPPQRDPLVVSDSTGLSYFVSMTNPNADAYIVQGIGKDTEGTGYRWAFSHPVLQFRVPYIQDPRFRMDFALPPQTFRITGPVTLTFSLNGRTFDKARFDQPGPQHYERAVPAGFLRNEAINQVSIEPDKFYTAPEDGAKLAFVLLRVGFVE